MDFESRVICCYVRRHDITYIHVVLQEGNYMVESVAAVCQAQSTRGCYNSCSLISRVHMYACACKLIARVYCGSGGHLQAAKYTEVQQGCTAYPLGCLKGPHYGCA